MNKIKNVILSILACLLILPSLVLLPVSVANAKNDNAVIDYKMTIKAILDDFIQITDRHNRFAGSKEEYNSALFIKDKMIEFGLSPVSNQSTNEGIQKFDIQLDSGLASSQNVIFKKAGTASDKKVIIATHYDTPYVVKVNDEGKVVKSGSEGVSESGVNVATLLLLAQLLNFESFNFDIEFVFFGAHNHNLAGSSYYTSFISSDDADDILLMINLDNLVSDDIPYVYNGELKNKTDDYVYSTFASNFNARNRDYYSIISNTTESSVTGLDYTNFALESDNANFIRVGVKTLSPFSVNKSQINSLDMISDTPIVSIQNDTLDDVIKATNGKYLNCPSLIINGCLNLLKDNDFKAVMEQNDLSSLYNFLGNKKLMVFIAFVLLIVIVFVYSIIKYYLEKKALKVREDIQLDKVIATIVPSELDDMDALMDRLEKQFEENAKKLEEKNKMNQVEKQDDKTELNKETEKLGESKDDDSNLNKDENKDPDVNKK